MATDTSTAFFSYSRADSEFALRLAEDLKAAGATVWLDQLDIEPGQRWARAVENALKESPIVLVILSPASVGSGNVDDEVQFALKKNKRVIPILYRDCEIPYRLEPFQYADFRTDYSRGLKSVLKSLGMQAQDLGEAATRAVPPPVVQAKPPQVAAATTVTNPYLPRPKVRNPYVPDNASSSKPTPGPDRSGLKQPQRLILGAAADPINIPDEERHVLTEAWERYKTIVSEIVRLAKARNYHDIKLDLVASLDEPVRTVSTILSNYIDASLFYDLPLSTTASRTATPKSVEWSSDTRGLHQKDHWVIAGDDVVFVAWRQEATYFYIHGNVNNKFTEDDGFATTIARGERLIQIACP